MSTTAPDPDEDFLPPPPRSRWRRLRKLARWVLGAGAVIVLVLFVAQWQVGRVGKRHLNATTEHLDADEPGWGLDAILAERKRTEPPANENSAPRVLEVAERIPDEWRAWHTSDDAKVFGGQRGDNHLPPQTAIDAARKQAGETLFVRADAIRLRDTRGGAFPLTIPDNPIAMSFPHLDKCRSVVSLLQYDADLACVEKNPNRGISAARAALAVARAIGDEPSLISQLVRIACATIGSQTGMQVLAWGEPTDGLVELQAELLAEADAGHFRVGVRGERALLDRVFRGLRDGTIPPEHWFTFMNIANPGPEDYAAYRAYRPLLPGDHAKTLEILTKYVEATNLPPHEQLAAIKAVPIAAGPPDEVRYILTRLLLPACEKIAQSGLRCRADLLAAATGVACERFRQKHNRWPHELAELVPAFLPAVPLSPFDGQPIKYRTFPDRIAVFSVWANAPQGAEGVPEDFRQGDAPGVGIGYRVWVPTRRGLPARETKQ